MRHRLQGRAAKRIACLHIPQRRLYVLPANVAHQPLDISPICRCPSGEDNQRLPGLIKHPWLESGGVNGYRKIHDDLREVAEDCGRLRVARLRRLEGLRSQTDYGRRTGKYGGRPAVTSPNLLKRQFDVVEPNKVWATDITYIRFARMKVGCIWLWCWIYFPAKSLAGQ